MTRHKQPTVERDTYVPKGRAPTAADGVPVREFEDLESETPAPVEVSAMAAYNHASNVQRRTANALTQIAHSSGVGMLIADEVQSVKDVAVEALRMARENDKRIKKWQALALSAMVTAGGSVVGVAKGLYSSGEEKGASAQVIRQLSTEVDRLRTQLDTVKDKLADMPRFPRLWDNQNKDQKP